MVRDVLTLTLALTAWPLFAQEAKVESVELAPSLHMLTGQGGNVVASLGDDGAFLVDDQYAPMTPKILAALARLAGGEPPPVRFVINTHWHADHSGGNQGLAKAGAVIVAHENVRQRMSVEQFIGAFKLKVPASPPGALPVLTFPDAVRFHWNGEAVEVLHVAPAHTDGDAVVRFVGANVLHTGDLYFNGFYPFFDASSGGSLDGMIAASERLLRLADSETKIVPGHGPLSNRRELAAFATMLRGVRDAIHPLVAAGKSTEEILAEKPTASYDAKWGGGFLKPDRFVRLVVDAARAHRPLAGGAFVLRADRTRRWFKGNTHAHSLWSDGDAAPEVVIQQHLDRGHQFLCLSEHNMFADGANERWLAVRKDGDLTPERVAALRAAFGAGWVEERDEGGERFMRLKTLDQLKARFDRTESFLLVPGQEVTSVRPPVHVNAFNTRALLPAANFVTLRDGFRENLAFVRQHGLRQGVRALAHLNHPNWQGGYSVEDALGAVVAGARHFEVFNGHPGVANWGDPTTQKVSTDRFWDLTLSLALRKDASARLYGLGVGDSHDYFEAGTKHANPGRAWIQVLSERLEADALVAAMDAGDYYASSGVELKEIAFDGRRLRIEIAQPPGVTTRVRFVGTHAGFDLSSKPAVDAKGEEVPTATRRYAGAIGQVLAETTDNPAVYTLRGTELYVRARIESSRAHANPFAEGDVEMAWTQPVFPARD